MINFNKMLIIPVLLLMTACSEDYAEDENYVHVKKDNVVCKQLKQEVKTYSGARGGSETYLETTSKCMFFKNDKELYYPQEVERRKKLEKMLDEAGN